MTEAIELEPRNRFGQPVACASVWVADPTERNGGHWTPQCANLSERNLTDLSGERYRCDVCGYSFYLDYEDMK